MNACKDSSNFEKACPPLLNVWANNLSEIVKSQEEEAEEWKKQKLGLLVKIEKLREGINRLKKETSQIEDEIWTQKAKDKACQAELRELRNSVNKVKYQIEKIRERISLVKTDELKDLENFEKAVDEITEKFRSIPSLYNRKNLLSRINEEKEVTKKLMEAIEEVEKKYRDFNKEKGLRERNDESEDLLTCLIPGSDLYFQMEMVKNLDIVIADIKNSTKDVMNKAELQELDHVASLLISEINEIKTRI